MRSRPLPPEPIGPETSVHEMRAATAEYIAQMAAELANIANMAQLDLLSYFLKMAHQEAESLLRERK